MSVGWKKIVLAAAGALTLTSAAQASEVNITIRTDSYGQPQRIADYNGDVFERREYRHSKYWYEHGEPDRYYGRPVPEWKERRHHWGAYYGVPVAERPVFAGPRWGSHDDCKIIIKERVNRWGEEVQVRRKVCR